MNGSIPWIEKYRPDNIDDIVLDEQTDKQIRIFLENRSDVHLIINGLPGVGKTSTVRCIAKKVLGEHMDCGYLELNAAEDRGVKSIGTIIPPFCMRIAPIKTSKIILLDEADNMTAKCQYDINDMIKKFGRTTKFIFTCNDSTKIIEDIQSVCRIIRFKKLTDDQIKKYMAKICKVEKIDFNDGGMNTICYISDGDMRKAINNLQLTAYSFDKVTKQTVLKICKMPDPEEIKAIIKLCLENKLDDSITALEKIISEGYYYLDIVTSFHYALTSYPIEEDLRIKLYIVVNQTKISVSSGLRSRLQLVAMICRLIECYTLYLEENPTEPKSKAKSSVVEI
jgi:replication factor C subunit 2/4